MVEDCEKKAAELGFDLTKQFITLALAGIAFIVGLSLNSPGAVSHLMLWLTVGTFGFSTVLGLAFLGHGVSLLSIQKSYDIYASSLRTLAIIQIVLVLIGVVLLAPIIGTRPAQRPGSLSTMEIKVGPGRSVVYPISPGMSVAVEVEGSKVTISPQPTGSSK